MSCFAATHVAAADPTTFARPQRRPLTGTFGTEMVRVPHGASLFYISTPSVNQKQLAIPCRLADNTVKQIRPG